MTLRALTGAEFVGALAAWAGGRVHWTLAGAVATIALIGFMRTWPEPARWQT